LSFSALEHINYGLRRFGEKKSFIHTDIYDTETKSITP